MQIAFPGHGCMRCKANQTVNGLNCSQVRLLYCTKGGSVAINSTSRSLLETPDRSLHLTSRSE